MDERAVKCKFVGYALNSRAYVFYVPSEQRTFVSQNAKFLEREFLLKKFSGSRLDLDEVQENQTNIDQTPRPLKRAAMEQPQGHELRRTSRERHEPKDMGSILMRNMIRSLTMTIPLALTRQCVTLTQSSGLRP